MSKMRYSIAVRDGLPHLAHSPAAAAEMGHVQTQKWLPAMDQHLGGGYDVRGLPGLGGPRCPL